MIKTSELGLPLEYKKLPEFFDAHNISDDTISTNIVIEKLLNEQNVKSVLDFTCGTGSQVFFLKKTGYDIVGVDFCPALLKIARNKALQKNLSINFIDGDMRSSKIGKYDAVITIFNAIGHLSKNDFQNTLKNIYNNLNDGGVYVFDIFNLEAMNDDFVNDLAMNYTKFIDDCQLHHIQHSTINRIEGLLTSFDTYNIQKNNNKTKTLTNTFSLQIYSSKELGELLTKNGFKTLGQYSLDKSKFVEEKSINILTVAKKI